MYLNTAFCSVGHQRGHFTLPLIVLAQISNLFLPHAPLFVSWCEWFKDDFKETSKETDDFLRILLCPWKTSYSLFHLCYNFDADATTVWLSYLTVQIVVSSTTSFTSYRCSCRKIHTMLPSSSVDFGIQSPCVPVSNRKVTLDILWHGSMGGGGRLRGGILIKYCKDLWPQLLNIP